MTIRYDALVVNSKRVSLYLNLIINLKLLKMRYPKYLINAFAILGVASFIFLACSAAETSMDNEDPIENNDDNDDNNNPPIQNNYGKYQVSSVGGTRLVILNTETGVLKTYYYDGFGDLYEGYFDSNPGAGSITVSH